MSNEKEAKKIRAAIREELATYLDKNAPSQVLGWLTYGISELYTEVSRARQFIAAFGQLAERPEYANLGRDMMAILNPPKEEPVEAPEHTAEEEAAAKSYLDEERVRLRAESK